MPPRSGEGMSDSPSRGLSTSREPALEHAPDHHGPEEHEEFTDPLSALNSLRRPASTSRTYGRCAVDPSGRSLTPTPQPGAPQCRRRTARRKIKNKNGG